MNRREVLKTLPVIAVGAALAPKQLFAQNAGRRIPLGIQYGGAGATADANKMKMETFKQMGYDLIEPTNVGSDPSLFRKQAEEVGLGLHSIHISNANTAPRGQGAHLEQDRQRLHRRRLAAGRRGREAAAARLAAVALAAVRHAVPDVRPAPAMLAAQPAHAAPPRPRLPGEEVGVISQTLSVSQISDGAGHKRYREKIR
jgi:hypothetical protein